MSRTAPGPLVGTDWLAGALGSVRVIEIRSEADYAAAHLPGSVRSDYAADGWRAVTHGSANRLPEPQVLAVLIGKLGLRPNETAVIVPEGLSANDFNAASRVYWTLRVAGHAGIAILDGGFAAWKEEGRAVETGPSPVAAGLYPVAVDARWQTSADEIEAGLGGATTFLDGRDRATFEGQAKPSSVARAGHLPGARHRDHAEAFDPATHRLKPAAELAALYGDVPGGPVVSYCNTGHSASLNWFVLSELFGRKDVRLYDGSMSDWTSDSSRPVETGPARTA